jgi:hypothetical protein
MHAYSRESVTTHHQDQDQRSSKCTAPRLRYAVTRHTMYCTVRARVRVRPGGARGAYDDVLSYCTVQYPGTV